MTLIKTLYLIEEYLFSLGYFTPYKTYPDDGYRFYYNKNKTNNTDSAQLSYAEFDYDDEDDDGEEKIIVISYVTTPEGLVISKYKETPELFDFEKLKTIITE